MIKQWILNILLGIDQLVNCIFGGDPDETISSRLGKLKRRHGGTIPWYRPFSGLIDFLLDKVDPHHSIDAIEEDEGSEAIIDKNGGKKMNDLLARIKDKGTTIPGLIISVMAIIALFKEYAQQIINAVADLGYDWSPDPTTVALVLIIILGLKMIFLDGGKKNTPDNPINLTDEVK